MMIKHSSHKPNNCMVIAVLGALLLFGSSFVQAKDRSVGTVIRAIGDSVVVGNNGEQRDLESQAAIFTGDTIITADDGWVTVNFYDLTRVVLRPNSEFEVRKFPATKDRGVIEMALARGAVRLATGTIAAQSRERFTLLTPQGRMQAGKAEWVVRLCEAEQCQQLEATFPRCSNYQTVESEDRQFLSVYRGDIRPTYCTGAPKVGVGQSLVKVVDESSVGECQTLKEVPCFILFDGKLGRDKARQLMGNLTPVGDSAEPPKPSQRGNRPPPRGGRSLPGGRR